MQFERKVEKIKVSKWGKTYTNHKIFHYSFVSQNFYRCHNEIYLPAFGSATTSTRSAPARLPPSLPSRTISTTTTRTTRPRPPPWQIRIPEIRWSDHPTSIRGKTIWRRRLARPIRPLITEQVNSQLYKFIKSSFKFLIILVTEHVY